VHPFRYIRPRTLPDAFGLLAEHGSAARALAGGTDLIVRLQLGHVRPAVVVDLKHLERLHSGLVERDGVLSIGASSVMTDIAADPRVRRHFPALVEAASVVGSIQIRNRATLAGNICNASPAADTAPALLVYGATVNLLREDGVRKVALAEFFTGPGRTVLAPGELVESIELPIPAEPAGAAFGRVTRRRGVDLATINLCCLVSKSGLTRFAYGAVGPRPFIVEDASGVLADPAAPAGAREQALAGLLTHATPISDVRSDRDYREAMLTVMSRRALAASIERLGTAGQEGARE
jgi:carbon-monoxide dehydrogenase medium subunit